MRQSKLHLPTNRTRRKLQRTRQNRFLQLETLERRNLLAVIAWTGLGDAQSWHDSANWAGSVVPGADDDALIEAAAPGSGVEYNAGNSIVQSVSSEKPFTVSGGKLTINQASSVASFTFSSGEVDGAGDLSINNSLAWFNGRMSGTGKTIVAAGATGSLASFDTGGGLLRTLENHGELTLGGDKFYLVSTASQSGVLANMSDGTLLLSTGSDLRHFVSGDVIGPGLLTNAGTIRKTNSSTVDITPEFENLGGTVDVQAGTLNLSGNITLGQTTLTGGDLTLAGGELNFQPGTSIVGSGSLNVAGITNVVNDGVVAKLNVYSGDLTGPGNVTVTDELTWFNGRMSGTGKTIVAPGATGSLASFDTGGGLLRMLENHGELTLGGDKFYLVSTASQSGVLANMSDGTLLLSTGSDLRHFVSGNVIGPGLLTNAGTIQKTNSSTVDITPDFENLGGTINIQAGTLNLSGNTTLGQTTLTGGDLTLAGGALNFQPGTSVVGSGSLNVAGIINVVNDGVVAKLNVYSGDLTGPGNVTVTEVLAWFNGRMSGTGKTIVAPGATGSLQTFDTGGGLLRTLENHGELSLDGNQFYVLSTASQLGVLANMADGTLISNTGSDIRHFTFGEITGPGLVTNAGTIRQSIGIPVDITSDFQNNGGTIDIQAGTLNLLGKLDFGPTTLTGLGELQITGDEVSLDGAAFLNTAPGNTLRIAGSLDGTTTNADRFSALGQIVFTGGTTTTPRLIEAMGADRGATAEGFQRNFAFGLLSLNTSAYARLIDLSDNASGSAAEAAYVDTLIVPSTATLDLNSLNLYARVVQIDGTVIGGNVTVMADSANLPMNSSLSGTIAAVGEQDEWTFQGFANQSIAVVVNPGGTGSLRPIGPNLGAAQFQVLDPSGVVIGSSSGAAGETVELIGLDLGVSGTYRIRVHSATAQPSGTGNYELSLYESGIDVRPLVFNQRELGAVENRFRRDQWTFTAAVGDSIRFDRLDAGVDDLRFNLTGPDGWSGFTGLQGDSDFVTLPKNGEYVLEASISETSELMLRSGTYSFRVEGLNSTEIQPGVPYQSTFVERAEARLLTIDIADSGPLGLVLNDSVGAGQTEVYARFGLPPTRREFDFATGDLGADQSLAIPNAISGRWYILVYAAAVPVASDFVLLADVASLVLEDFSPVRHGNSTKMLLTVDGAGFSSQTIVELVASDGSRYQGEVGDVVRPTRINVNFPAAMPAGDYFVEATSGGATVRHSQLLRVTQAGEPKFEARVIAPGRVGLDAPATFYVEYANTGDVSMPAPLLELIVSNNALLTLDQSRVVAGNWTSATPDDFTDTIQFMASGTRPGMLQAGETVTIPIYYVGLQKPWPDGNFSLDYELNSSDVNDPEILDWTSLKTVSQPSYINDQAWDVVWSNLITQLGVTRGDYVKRLGENAAYFADIGAEVYDVTDLWDYEIRKAFGFGQLAVETRVTDRRLLTPGPSLDFEMYYSGCIVGRFESGPLGQGWFHNWQRFLEIDTDGSVTVHGHRGVESRFQPDQRGGFLSEAGDDRTLVQESDGTYVLAERSGTREVYLADGRFSWIEDLNGNRITAQYTNALMARLDHSSGEWIQFGYDSEARITTILDSANRQTTFAYAGIYLSSILDTEGQTTQYTYQETGPAATLHAMLSEERLDGAQAFAYDALGRLASIEFDGGGTLLYSYDDPASVSITNLLGDRHQYFYDQRGLVLAERDAEGDMTYYSFDSEQRLDSVTDTLGTSSAILSDASGELTGYVDRLHSAIEFSFTDDLSLLESATDANGNTTHFEYDTAGNPIRVVYADGSFESFEIGSDGNFVGATNRRGQELEYTRDVNGRILSRTYSDGTQDTFVYDALGNLTSTTGANGTTTFQYDASGNMTQVTYPSGKRLDYTYDVAGRRELMRDQDGHEVNYGYDSEGRLASLKDENGLIITAYEFDIVGRLSKKLHGNGTFSTYGYDEIGRLVDLTNFASENVVNSFYRYIYDSLGNRDEMQTHEGLWTYQHDVEGRLIAAVFDSSLPSIPDVDLAFQYDAAGNRTVRTSDGVENQYESNELNQLIADGNGVLQYDLDGNRVSRSETGDETRYVYDELNQLVQVTSASDTWIYEYDPLGQRIAMTHNGQRTEFLNDPTGISDVVAEYDSTGQLRARYTYGIDLTSRVDAAGNATYFDMDEIGSVVGVSGGLGSYLNAYTYLPYGGVLHSTEAIDNPFQFIGAWGVMAEDNGLHFMRNRFYDSATGTFLSTDPLWIPGTSAYEYANNNPLQFADADGLKPKKKPLSPKWKEILERYRKEAEKRWEQERNNPSISKRIRDLVGQNSKDAHAECEADPNCQPRRNAGGNGGRGDGGPQGGGVGGSQGSGSKDNQDNKNAKDPPPVCGCDVRDEGTVGTPRSRDPNQKLSVAGFGDEHFVAGSRTVPYRIEYENLGPGSVPAPAMPATAPAQRVEISDQLTGDLDWNSVEFSEFGFGDFLFRVPSGRQYHSQTVSVNYDGKSLEVDIELRFDALTGMLTAVFQSVDPETLLPPSVLVGFLPPEDGSGVGRGFVGFRAGIRPGIPSGTELRNVALIRFDGQSVIATNQIDPQNPLLGTSPDLEAMVTIDAGAPESSLAPAATTTSGGEVLIVWNGADAADESGLRDYTIFVSENGAEPRIWIERTTAVQATFSISLGSSYEFYSIATDNVGNTETRPLDFDFTIDGIGVPHVQSVRINGGQTQRSAVHSATVIFDRHVEVSVADEEAFQIVNTTTGAVVATSRTILDVDGRTEVQLSFLPGPAVGANGALVDGNYQLVVKANRIIGGGLIMDGNGDGAGGDDYVFGAQAADSFFRFFGDSDGDRDVDGQDYGRFGLTFLKSSGDPGFDPTLDFDGDGDVDGQDYGQFRSRFLRAL